MPKRVVVPLDQSPVSESVLPFARGLATRLDLPITLLSVIEVPDTFSYFMPGPRGAGHVSQRLQEAASTPYGSWQGGAHRQPTTEQVERVSGKVSEAESYLNDIAKTFGDRILQVAEMRDDSLIAMASHGRGGLQRALVGSVAMQVVRASHSPVFMVRGSDNAPGSTDATEIRSVLVPLDGSPFAEQGLRSIEDVFKPNGLELHLLYVVEEHIASGSYAREVIDDFQFASHDQATRYLTWVKAGLEARGFKIMSQDVTDGSPAREINRVAGERHVDLIAMTTHGYTGLSRIVLGSIADLVLREATLPLMLIRPEEPDVVV